MEAVTPVKVSDDHERIYEEWGKKCLLRLRMFYVKLGGDF